MSFLVPATILHVNRNRTECHFDGTDYDLNIIIMYISFLAGTYLPFRMTRNKGEADVITTRDSKS